MPSGSQSSPLNMRFYWTVLSGLHFYISVSVRVRRKETASEKEREGDLHICGVTVQQALKLGHGQWKGRSLLSLTLIKHSLQSMLQPVKLHWILQLHSLCVSFPINAHIHKLYFHHFHYLVQVWSICILCVQTNKIKKIKNQTQIRLWNHILSPLCPECGLVGWWEWVGKKNIDKDIWDMFCVRSNVSYVILLLFKRISIVTHYFTIFVSKIVTQYTFSV